MDRMDRKWTRFGQRIQEGYELFETKMFYENGQKWTKMDKMDSSIQEGYELFEMIESHVTSCVNMSRHFEINTNFASQSRTILRQSFILGAK